MAYLGVVAEDELQDARLSKTLGLWNEVDLVASLELPLEVIPSCGMSKKAFCHVATAEF